MKKLLILMALCMVFSVVMVACQDTTTPDPETSAESTTEAPSQTEAETEAPSETETETETETEAPSQTETETDAPTSDETTTEEETTPPADPVKVGMSFDECDMWINIADVDTNTSANSQGSIFTPGQSANWDLKAIVDDYNIAYLRVWGWVAFFAETEGTFGYQIGDNEPVFDAAFSVPAEQAVLDAAASQGGKSASRMKIMIPVRDLSGDVVIKALVKDAVGTVETITEFTMTKAVDPESPVFLFDAAAIFDTASGANTANHANQVGSAVLSEDGSYVTLTSAESGGDPWFMFRGVKANAQYIAVKYRTTIENKQFHYFVSSTGDNATGQGDMSDVLSYTADGEWHIAVIDISGVAAVNEENFVSFLRYDFYTNGTSESLDVAWIGAFNAPEYAEAWDARVHPEVVEPWNVDFTKHAISGSYPDLWAANLLVPGMSESELIYVAHYGSINLGEVDLSKYSKVTVTYGTPAGYDINGGDFAAQYEATAKRVMLLNTASAIQEGSLFEYLPEDGAIIASAQYDMSSVNMEIKSVEIDLTAVDYNGQTYLTFDFRNANNEFGATSYLIVVTGIVFE